MKQAFTALLLLDALMLLVPTRWMGPIVEFWTAVTLAAATVVLYFGLRGRREDL